MVMTFGAVGSTGVVATSGLGMLMIFGGGMLRANCASGAADGRSGTQIHTYGVEVPFPRNS